MIAAPDLSALNLEVTMPTMYRVRQHFDAPILADIEGETRRQVRKFAHTIKPGARIAITGGSRGIANIPRIIRAVGDEVRALGGVPFLMPAMGSHGGATAEGQIVMLADLGMTEASTGMPIVSSMEVRQVGQLEGGPPVFCSVTALEADGVILVNRIKPHTDFNAQIESGLAKICTIGLGKQKGAETIHSFGVPGLAKWMPLAAKVNARAANVLFGVAAIENAYDQTAIVESIAAVDIAGAEEIRLQDKAKSLMASLPFDNLDVLVVDEMGKNISGCGMDTNVVGRMMIRGCEEFARPNITNIAVLDLTDASHGNASGLGVADFISQRLAEKVDFAAFYINCLTAGIGGVQRGQMPIVMPNDRSAVSVAMRTSGEPDNAKVTLVHIKNTLEIGEIDISASLLDQARSLPHLELVGAARGPLGFDTNGAIQSSWGGGH
jgi:hypothetical protein